MWCRCFSVRVAMCARTCRRCCPNWRRPTRVCRGSCSLPSARSTAWCWPWHRLHWFCPTPPLHQTRSEIIRAVHMLHWNMNLHQFRFVQEAVRRDLNLTETAKALFTSQPGVSKAILELEGELGVDIFARHGKRLRRVTEPGMHVLKSIEIIMREVGNLKRIGEEFSKQDSGTLSIATTHSQARYFLPEPLAQLRKRFPKVNISLHQGAPAQVAQMVIEEVADIGIATEALAEHSELISLPCYEWQHAVVMPAGHPLA